MSAFRFRYGISVSVREKIRLIRIGFGFGENTETGPKNHFFYLNEKRIRHFMICVVK